MNKKSVLMVILFGVLLLGGLVLYEYRRFDDRQLHVIFCNVGQGDAIFIRTPGGKNIMIDGGPDKEVLSCLGHYMPFWDRTFQILFLTHPHDDHFAGIHYVMERYIALSFVIENLTNNTIGFSALKNKVKELHIPVQSVYAGDTFSFPDGVIITVLGPDETYLTRTSPNGQIGESGEFASLILQVSYGDFDVLLTGDSQKEGLQNAGKYGFQSIEVLQVPHHGSKTGLDTNTIQLVAPKQAVVSVGKNRYGHPSKEIIRLMDEHEIPISRTDRDGNIEFVSDGKQWWKVQR
jgi:competence protein ComEC